MPSDASCRNLFPSDLQFTADFTRRQLVEARLVARLADLVAGLIERNETEILGNKYYEKYYDVKHQHPYPFSKFTSHGKCSLPDLKGNCVHKRNPRMKARWVQCM